jgi:nucleoside-diphosphate-sugar epimerase
VVIRQAPGGNVIRIFGHGAQLSDYILVDIVNAALKRAAAPRAVGEVTNAASGQSSRFEI